MASNNTYLSPQGRENGPDDWENIKADVHRFYLEEGKTLEQTRAQIQTMRKFQST